MSSNTVNIYTPLSPQIVEYFDNARRPFVEGKKILHADHLSDVRRIRNPSEKFVKIVATCEPISHPDDPLFIEVEYNTDGISYGSCSCTEGTNVKCEHICALLMYLDREDISELEICSYIRWLLNKKKIRNACKPIPISEFCCVEKAKRKLDSDMKEISPELLKHCFSIMFEGFKDSICYEDVTKRKDQADTTKSLKGTQKSKTKNK